MDEGEGEVTPEPANTAFLVAIPALTPMPGRIHAQVAKVIEGHRRGKVLSNIRPDV